MNKIREELAAYAHQQWSGWMKYLFNNCEYLSNGEMRIPKWAVDRWSRQMSISYKDLPETEKSSDRSKANGILRIISRDEEIKKLKEEIEHLAICLNKAGLKS